MKFDAPSHLYIMEHLEYPSIKVGISNDEARTNRIRNHESEEWVLGK